MPATRLRRSVRRWENVAIIAVAIGCLIRGLAYMPPLKPATTPQPLAFVDIPIGIYAVLWLLIFPLSVVAIRWRRLWVPAMSAAAGLTYVWCGAYLGAWLVLDSPRAWLSSVTYGVFAFMITCLVRIASLADRMAALVQKMAGDGH